MGFKKCGAKLFGIVRYRRETKVEDRNGRERGYRRKEKGDVGRRNGK